MFDDTHLASKSRDVSRSINTRSQLAQRAGSDAAGLRRKLHRCRTSFTVHQLDQLETGDVTRVSIT